MEIRQYSRAYVASLPVSTPVYPDGFLDKLKYYTFKAYSPIHPFCRDFLSGVKLIHSEGRQDYLLGVLKPEKSVDGFLTHLVKNGFGNHFIAWHDEGEIASLRFVESFSRQYHIRVFEDGEVRGHYEYTPEYNPVWHIIEKDQTDGRERFSKIVKDWVDEVESKKEARTFRWGIGLSAKKKK